MKVPQSTLDLISGLPGEEIITPGLHDLEKGIFGSVEALIIQIARIRLTESGLSCLSNLSGALPENPEEELYNALVDSAPEDPYGRYNSLKRRLTSFASALDHRQRLNESIPV